MHPQMDKGYATGNSAVRKKRCWELVLLADVKPNIKVLPGRWVYKTKTKDDRQYFQVGL